MWESRFTTCADQKWDAAETGKERLRQRPGAQGQVLQCYYCKSACGGDGAIPGGPSVGRALSSLPAPSHQLLACSDSQHNTHNTQIHEQWAAKEGTVSRWAHPTFKHVHVSYPLIFLHMPLLRGQWHRPATSPSRCALMTPSVPGRSSAAASTACTHPQAPLNTSPRCEGFLWDASGRRVG